MNINIDGNNFIDPLNRMIVVIKSTGRRTDTVSNNPFRIRHLIVNTFQNRSLFITHGSHDEQEIGLARRKADELSTKTRNIITTRNSPHKLNRAAGGSKRKRPERILSRPV